MNFLDELTVKLEGGEMKKVGLENKINEIFAEKI